MHQSHLRDSHAKKKFARREFNPSLEIHFHFNKFSVERCWFTDRIESLRSHAIRSKFRLPAATHAFATELPQRSYAAGNRQTHGHLNIDLRHKVN